MQREKETRSLTTSCCGAGLSLCRFPLVRQAGRVVRPAEREVARLRAGVVLLLQRRGSVAHLLVCLGSVNRCLHEAVVSHVVDVLQIDFINLVCHSFLFFK